MSKKRVMVLIGLAAMFGAACTPAGEDSWSKAGKEVGEAAGAVGDASVETSKDAWDATKRGSAQVWDKTKEVSGEAWDASKEAVHDGADYVKDKTADD